MAAIDTCPMRLLERDTPLATLVEYGDDARQGDGRLVLIAGEAGVGKSALVEQFQRRMQDARWAWGSCDGLSTPRPLGPLFDIAAEVGGELLELCRLRAPREELFDAFLRRLAEPDLDVVVVEDIHWADDATIDLLRFLSRRLRKASALIVVTYRDDGLTATDPLRIALGEFATQRSTRRIGLAPLSAEAVRVIADGTGLEAAELYRLTAGNPFYVTEVIRAGAVTVPPSARDAVLARVARLSDESRAVLEVAALIGVRMELRLLESVTACSPSSIDELVTSGSLVSEGASLRFRPEIARRAVEETIASYRCVSIHARILESMLTLSSDDAEIAYHAEAAGDGKAVLMYAHRAARRAAELASHREAAAQYERATRFTDGAEPAFVAELYDGLADELSLVDGWQEAAVAQERALALWREAGNNLRAGDTQRKLGTTLWRLCRGSESTVAVEEAVATLEPLGPTPELARAYAALAFDRAGQGARQVAIELAQRACTIGKPLGATDVVSDALNTEGSLQLMSGGDGVGLLQQALDAAVTHGHEAQAGRAYVNLYTNLALLRRFAEAEQYYVDGRAYCDDHELTTYGNCLRGSRSIALGQVGRWDEAVELGTEILDRAGPGLINRLPGLVGRGIVGARRGNAKAWQDIHEAVALADGTEVDQWIAFARLALVEAHWLEGDLDRARQAAESAADHLASCELWDRGAIVVWLRRTGSRRVVDRHLPEPYQFELEGKWEKAAQLWFDLGCDYEAALVLLDSANEAALRRALTIFDQLGAKPAVRIAQQTMRSLGIRSVPNGAQAATRANPLGLTRREQDVLELICSGHTNAEIAVRLVISERTVDHHVSAVLAKLNAPTRKAAASAAARMGLAGAANSR
jgi:DNA-binding CsgD family transcriptional regulator/tetratricopeptide (TPR) repeat protein